MKIVNKCLIASGLCLVVPFAHAGGGGVAGATEFTQILNNIQLGGMASTEAAQLQQQVASYAQFVQQTQVQLQTWEQAVIAGTSIGNAQWGDFAKTVQRVKSAVDAAQGLSTSVQNLDKAFETKFPGYQKEMVKQLVNTGRAAQTLEQRATDARKALSDTVGATMRNVSATSADLEDEAATLNYLQGLSDSSVGQMQAVQAATRVNGLVAQQLMSLRQITASQVVAQNAWQKYQQDQTDADRMADEAAKAERNAVRRDRDAAAEAARTEYINQQRAKLNPKFRW